ncbi:hypothetical protein V6Z11_A11G039500 [Gossypium hirsutum]
MEGLLQAGSSYFYYKCAIKVDLQNAFDSLHWGFLLTVLEGYFKGARGVRQGYKKSRITIPYTINGVKN